jgi:hypothetical protein
MPATRFICPSGKSVKICECLEHCREKERCMFLPTLRAIADSLNRKVEGATVTELLAGTRETYLKKTTEYAVRPQDQLYAIHGTAFHAVNEGYTDGNMLSEERLRDNVTSGKFDLYGEILSGEDNTLGDFKVTSSYKLMRALGIYKKDVPTGETYKSGLKKGQPKTRKEFCYDGVRFIMDWALQLNYYRILLEAQGLKVGRMVIQAMCRDFGLRIAAERGIHEPVQLIPVRKISDCWITRYMLEKTARLTKALETNSLPEVCSSKERWHDKKCQEYCPVAGKCPYGQAVLAKRDKLAV